MRDVDAGDQVEQRRPVPASRRAFPELITEDVEKGEDQLHGTAAAPVIKWHEAWRERKLVHYIVD
ncbi:MAG: hypothetical protein F4Z38_01200 [Chloroflexi bacterium]|nr:hypothetical protein [Chloroflexota bacterium]